VALSAISPQSRRLTHHPIESMGTANSSTSLRAFDPTAACSMADGFGHIFLRAIISDTDYPHWPKIMLRVSVKVKRIPNA
jgi:hypothetical protein